MSTLNNLGLPVIKKLSIWTILNQTTDFISLDISSKSTGWAKYEDGKLYYGTFSITEDKEHDVERRREFRQFLIGLMGTKEWPTVYVEETIMGVNYETDKLLHQLNCIVDDLVDMGILHAKTIKRENNGTWKRRLTEFSGVRSKVKGNTNVKELVQEQLHYLGFNEERKDIAQDVYDAIGMAIGTIHGELSGDVVIRAVKKELSKGYKLKQYFDEDAAYEYALKRVNGSTEHVKKLDFLESRKSVEIDFRNYVSVNGDKFVFLLAVNGRRLGILGVQKELDTTEQPCYIVAYNETVLRGIKKRLEEK